MAHSFAFSVFVVVEEKDLKILSGFISPSCILHYCLFFATDSYDHICHIINDDFVTVAVFASCL